MQFHSFFCLLVLLLVLLTICQDTNGSSLLRKRIVNGRASTRGQWPWLVSLKMLKNPAAVEMIRKTRNSDAEDLLKRKQEVEMMIAAIVEAMGEKVFRMLEKNETRLIMKQLEKLNKLKQLRSRQSQEEDHVPTFEGHMCSGSLINDRWIISARHCFDKTFNYNLTDDPSRWTAEIGEYSLSGVDGHERSHKLEKIIFHEAPSSHPNFNDIAMLKLAEAVEMTPFVQPIRLSTAEHRPGELCTVAGWGHTKYNGEMTDVIHHVEVPLIAREDCSSEWDITEKPGPAELCAGGESDGDACQYDSGGPLVCRHGKGYEQVGIVSRGDGCGDGFPGIYTNVTSYLDWIYSILATE